MRGAWDRPVQRTGRLLAGLVLFGLALAVLVEADLGLDPWTVFNQGVSEHTGLTIGQVTVIGPSVIPEASGLAAQTGYAVAAIVATAVATGLYVGAGWGPGPRDGLMTGMAARGVPIARARASVELTVLVVGWLLGGTVGVATVLFAVSIGPLVRLALARLSIHPRPEPSRPACPRPAGAGHG